MAGVKVTPEQWADKQARNLKNSIEDMRIGIENVTEAPGAKAAKQADKWAQNLQASKDKWAKNTAAVPLDDWKAKMINKGLSRVGPGIDAARDKVVAHAEKVTPHIETGMRELERMPDLTLQDSVERAAFWIRHMATFNK